LRRIQDLAYGSRAREKLDIFPAEDAPSPVGIFIHGGYWRGGHKDEYSFVASGLVPAGITTVVLGYDLCPTVTLDQLVDQVRRGILWVHRNIEDYGGDPSRLFLSGNSAGAHLAAMALAHDWSKEQAPEDLIAGAFLISGVYELEPVLGITVNEEIQLKPEMVDRNSPMRHPPRTKAPVMVAVGGNEPSEWIRQSRDYAALCERSGNPVGYMEVEGHHHFSITNLLGDPDADLTRALVRFAQRR
jgi:arylformamidase